MYEQHLACEFISINRIILQEILPIFGSIKRDLKSPERTYETSHFSVDRTRSPHPKRHQLLPIPLPLFFPTVRANSKRVGLSTRSLGGRIPGFSSSFHRDHATNGSLPCHVVPASGRNKNGCRRCSKRRENVRLFGSIRRRKNLRNRSDKNVGKQETRGTKKKRGNKRAASDVGKGDQKRERREAGNGPKSRGRHRSDLPERRRRNIEQKLMFPESGSLVHADKWKGIETERRIFRLVDKYFRISTLLLLKIRKVTKVRFFYCLFMNMYRPLLARCENEAIGRYATAAVLRLSE